MAADGATPHKLCAGRASALVYRWTYVEIAHHTDADVLTFLAGRLAGTRVVDCGCGPGVFAEKLVRSGIGNLIAVDADPSMVRQARTRLARYGESVRVVREVVDERFFSGLREDVDLVVFKRSLYAPRKQAVETLRDAVAAVGRSGTVLVVHPERSFGRYAFGDPPRPRSYSAYHVVNRIVSRVGARLGLGDYTLYTRAELVALLKEAAPGRRVVSVPTRQASYVIAAIVPSSSGISYTR